MTNLSGQVALVTGGASGIGFAAVQSLARAGAAVAIVDRQADAAEAAAARVGLYGTSVESAVCDVTDEAMLDSALDRVTSSLGPPTIVVCSAGIAKRAPATEIDAASWRDVVEVNLTGSFLTARLAARRMIAHNRPGAVVFVASIMGFSGGGIYPNPAYQASKGAVVNLARALAVEWAPRQIRVNAVAPTWVRTPLIEPLLADPRIAARIAEMTPLGRVAEPEEVAAAITFLASPAASMITGHTLPIDGGYLAQ